MIAVAMSGGVDSSVAAALLVDQGLDVFGVMLRLWVEPGRTNRCCSPADVAAARRVAAHLGIPFYALDLQASFRDVVVDPFLRAYEAGRTPNPCMECNRTIRWTLLRTEAATMGAAGLATGHYARLRRGDGVVQLLRAVDPAKDQSYVLSLLDQEALRVAHFPLGSRTKDEVREIARRRGLPTAERRESQDLCFLGGEDYRPFLRRHASRAAQPGPIVDIHGTRLGMHDGLADFTIGQRRGIGVASSEPLYVIEKDLATHTLIVGPGRRRGRAQFRVETVNWIEGRPPSFPCACEVQVRYRSAAAPAQVEPISDQGVTVRLNEPLPAVTPGQAAVFYRGDVCLGGGIIAS